MKSGHARMRQNYSSCEAPPKRDFKSGRICALHTSFNTLVLFGIFVVENIDLKHSRNIHGCIQIETMLGHTVTDCGR